MLFSSSQPLPLERICRFHIQSNNMYIHPPGTVHCWATSSRVSLYILFVCCFVYFAGLINYSHIPCAYFYYLGFLTISLLHSISSESTLISKLEDLVVSRSLHFYAVDDFDSSSTFDVNILTLGQKLTPTGGRGGPVTTLEQYARKINSQ